MSKLVLDSKGVRELLKSQEMMNECMHQAENINARYGGKGSITSYVGKRRVNVSIRAKRGDYSNDLIKAMK